MRDYLGTDLRHRIGGGYENLFLAWKVGFYAIFITKLKLFQFSQDKMRIFSPDVNQEANAWAMDYRRYHDLFVLDNKKELVFANLKDAK